MSRARSISVKSAFGPHEKGPGSGRRALQHIERGRRRAAFVAKKQTPLFRPAVEQEREPYGPAQRGHGQETALLGGFDGVRM